MLIPYGIQTYKRGDLPQVRLTNLYAEKAETVAGNVVLFPRPALKPWEVVGTGPSRGLYYRAGALGDAVFAVSGPTLYGNGTELGTIPGTGLVSMVNADTYLMVANDLALYIANDTSFQQVAFPDGNGVSSVAYLGGYALAAQADSRHIYFTLDETTWDPLDFVSAEQSTAKIIGMAIVVDQLWVFCSDHTEIFYLSGDSAAPLERVQGRVFDKGALTRDSIVRADNTAFWVGSDGVVYRGENVPKRLSDNGIEERIAASDAADITAWVYPWKGHLFLVLHLTDGTVCYDPSTEQWHDLDSYGLARWRALTGIQYGRNILAGDSETGQIWTLADGSYSDNGDVMTREFTILVNSTGFIDNLTLDCSAASNPNPNDPAGVIELRTSRNGGSTWTNWRQKSLGQAGKYRTLVGWRGLGIVDQGNMVIQIRITDPVASRISYVKVNEAQGGRSRG